MGLVPKYFGRKSLKIISKYEWFRDSFKIDANYIDHTTNTPQHLNVNDPFAHQREKRARKDETFWETLISLMDVEIVIEQLCLSNNKYNLETGNFAN